MTDTRTWAVPSLAAVHQDGGDDAIVRLIRNYHELNVSAVDELEEVPSSIQFLRYVATNRPFVVRKGAQNWDAVKKWNAHYLREILQDTEVRVAVTPKGYVLNSSFVVYAIFAMGWMLELRRNADAVVEDEQGNLLFVEPHEVYEDFNAFLDRVRDDEQSGRDRLVRYAQPQNDSLRNEYAVLFKDVPPIIDFASDALERDVDAVNFWLGNARSTTSLHKDNYENIYVQIRGTKNFTLLPPIEQPCVNETPLQFARYRPCTANKQDLQPVVDRDIGKIPVPLWDPDVPGVRSTVYSQHSQPIKVTLNEGDMMYLPAMWYHKVGQGNGAEGFSCSVNYWYDMDFTGSFWTNNAFIRDVYASQTRQD